MNSPFLCNQALNSTTHEYFSHGDTPQIASTEQIDEFLAPIMPTYSDFDVFLIVSKQVREVSASITTFRISIIDSLSNDLSVFANSRGFTMSDEEAFVQVEEIRAFDCNSAREEAYRRLDTRKDLFRLSYHKNQIAYLSEAGSFSTENVDRLYQLT